MALFSILSSATQTLNLHRTWLEVVGDNIANINTVRSTDQEAYRPHFIVAQNTGSGGARLGGIVRGTDSIGKLVHEPQHPLADENGYVRYPSIDLPGQMTQLLMAQRAYQLNLQTVSHAKAAYQSALSIGK